MRPIIVRKPCEHKKGYVIIVPFFFGLIKKHIFICRDCGFTALQKKKAVSALKPVADKAAA